MRERGQTKKKQGETTTQEYSLALKNLKKTNDKRYTSKQEAIKILIRVDLKPVYIKSRSRFVRSNSLSNSSHKK